MINYIKNIKNPAISVLLPVYNGQKYLENTIKQVFDQSFLDIELITIDDGSTDDSQKIVRNFKDKRIRLIENKKNKGLISSLNLGLKIAKGRYIARIDCDDGWTYDKLEKQYDYMIKNPLVKMTTTSYYDTNENGESGYLNELKLYPEEFFYRILFRCDVNHSTVMFHRKTVINIGGYNSKEKFVEDFGLWRRLALSAPCVWLKKNMGFRRHHSGSVSHQNYFKQQHAAKKIVGRYFEKIVGKEIDRKVIEKLYYWRLAWNNHINEDFFFEQLKDIHQAVLKVAPRYIDIDKLKTIINFRKRFYKQSFLKKKKFENWIIKFFNNYNPNEIAFYAGGTHTEWVFNILKNNRINFPLIIVDQIPERVKIKKVPVVTLEEAKNKKIKYIIISHETENKQIYKKLSLQFTNSNIKVIDPYRHL
jgi:glycosyltransferase involved in cell wall biosynthesis